MRSSRFSKSGPDDRASDRHAHQPYIAPSISQRSSTNQSRDTTVTSLDQPEDEYLGQDSGENFVSNPQPEKRGLSGKISTLFRRESPAARYSLETEGVRRKKPMMGGGSRRSKRSSGGEMEMSSNPSSSRGDFSEDEDDRSVARSVNSRASRGSISSAGSKRIFYSSHGDDEDSDDSFESRSTRQSRGKSGETIQTSDTNESKTIVRYRGFSTSIKNLFLDETVVCAAMGCFGLILSNRTEYLLNLRNERRGALKRHQNIERKKLPSRIVAYGLLVTIILMFTTFVVWGFGSNDNGLSAYNFDPYEVEGNGDFVNENYNQQQNEYQNGYAENYAEAQNYEEEQQYDYDQENGDYGNRRNRALEQTQSVPGFEHPVHGIFKLRDLQENIWDPIIDFVQYEWHREDKLIKDDSQHRIRQMEDAYDYQSGQASSDSFGLFDSSVGNSVRVALLFAFMLFLGILGRRRRMRTRFYLVRARAQEDHLYYASTEAGQTRRVRYDSSREDQYEGACSHTLCGWYPADEAMTDADVVDSVEVSDTGVFKRKKMPYHEDIVARTFNFIMDCCCGRFCKCWFQCLSICALAQEAREIRLLVPPRYQRIDFITHQPFHEYQKEVNDLRRGWLGKARKAVGFKPHWDALSQLSRYILVSFSFVVCVIVGTLLFNPRAAFSWPDAVVLGATFLQAFLVLFIVHWIFHRSDLSLDAVIKFFAAGFLIAVPSAFLFEAIVMNSTLTVAWTIYEIFLSIGGEAASIWAFGNWRWIWIVGELFNAYCISAFIEEICKYFTFRTIEHPDLVFLTGLSRDTQDASAVEGGLVRYPFASHQVQELNKTNSFGEMSAFSHRSRETRKSIKSQRNQLIERTGTVDGEFDEDENDVRTHRQRAMAITTAMISVAVGLACAENFLYVFVLGGAARSNANYADEELARPQNHLLEEWMVLFFRSIFPVHALAAALQSISVIKKFVEGAEDDGHRIGVGRILLPAVILHGTFDAILMVVNVYQETAWDIYLKDNNGVVGDDGGPYNPATVDVIAWIGITSVMILGILWYYRENRMQDARLKVLDATKHGGDWKHEVPTEAGQIV